MTKKSLVSIAVVVVGMVVIAVVVQAGLSAWIEGQNEQTLTTIDLRIAEQELLLVTVADLARRTEADEITNRIVVDCTAPERQRFDSLLDTLSLTISTPELRELDTLFYKCGSFYADRKAVMAARLHREVEVFEDYIALRSSLISAESEALNNRAALWRQLAESELTFADNFSSLVTLQGVIISSLIAGQGRDSEVIVKTLEEVTETRNKMTILSKQIENFRNEMQSL